MRTSVLAVKQILDNTTLSNIIIEAYINSANVMVTEVLGGTDLSDDTLTEIERWVAAHMVASTRERQAIKEAAGTASITYTGAYGVGLKSTSYGQMALTLDTSGLLAIASGGAKLASGGAKFAFIKAITSFDE